ncbi:hypothetical protein BU14_0086s0004 [Porphyra umbilicalis]|uniref:Uncharacterized protein n=1 Tax=Porphyra umbilicalis TaxID=2786 RepID=A0A1X6PE20_PORUM|nr:hypothetical protein BU14_0086s0004 [Porphyra umbilicalis]|eukprot:OSX79117.1 hypothetical protein BU14_0086s0004 [Porphyra umbilicalis]
MLLEQIVGNNDEVGGHKHVVLIARRLAHGNRIGKVPKRDQQGKSEPKRTPILTDISPRRKTFMAEHSSQTNSRKATVSNTSPQCGISLLQEVARVRQRTQIGGTQIGQTLRRIEDRHATSSTVPVRTQCRPGAPSRATVVRPTQVRYCPRHRWRAPKERADLRDRLQPRRARPFFGRKRQSKRLGYGGHRQSVWDGRQRNRREASGENVGRIDALGYGTERNLSTISRECVRQRRKDRGKDTSFSKEHRTCGQQPGELIDIMQRRWVHLPRRRRHQGSSRCERHGVRQRGGRNSRRRRPQDCWRQMREPTCRCQRGRQYSGWPGRREVCRRPRRRGSGSRRGSFNGRWSSGGRGGRLGGGSPRG